MADKYIGDLAKAEPNLTDYLVGINGTDAYQALVSDVAKKVIENYAGTTLMGTAQSVKNAFNGSNSLISANNFVGANSRQGWTALTNGQDLNSLTAIGIYYAPSGSVATSILNLPETPTVYGLFLLRVEHTGNNSQYIRQTITMPYATVVDGITVVERTYKRQTVNNGSTWTSWIFEPTRAEVNSIANAGAKNLLQNKASSVTKQGLTYTVNENGSVSVSGTATANSYLELSVAKTFASATIMSGCPSNTGLTIDVITPSQTYVDSGSGVVIPANATITAVRLRVANGTTVTNATFYPMLRHTNIIDDTYVPYGMSNAELTARNYVDSGYIARRRATTSLNLVINSSYNSIQKRLLDGWDTIKAALRERLGGVDSGFASFQGLIQMPAYNGGSNYGYHFIWGGMDLSDSDGSGAVFCTRYNGRSEGVFYLKKDTSGAYGGTIDLTGSEITLD